MTYNVFGGTLNLAQLNSTQLNATKSGNGHATVRNAVGGTSIVNRGQFPGMLCNERTIEMTGDHNIR